MLSVVCVKILLFSSLLAVVNAELQFRLSHTVTSWNQAWTVCDEANGSLAVLNNDDLGVQFSQDVVPTQGEEIWVGRYVAYSDLVWIYGCYGNNSLKRNIQDAHALGDNYLVTCLHACPGAPFIGMQDNLCYCIWELPGTSERVPGINCQSRCPGEITEKDAATVPAPKTQVSHCGRKGVFNTVSVYKRAIEKEVDLDPSPGQCVHYNTGTRRWQSDTCFQPMLFACDKRDCAVKGNQCVLKSTSPSSWFDARTKCEGNDGLLSIINATTNVYFDARNVNQGDAKYWTGLHRKEADLWIVDKERTSTRPSDRCISVQKQPSGTWTFKTQQCDRRLRFVCLQDYTPPKNNVTTRRPPLAQTTDGEFLPTVNPHALPVNVTSGAIGRMFLSGFTFVCSSCLSIFLTFLLTLS